MNDTLKVIAFLVGGVIASFVGYYLMRAVYNGVLGLVRWLKARSSDLLILNAFIGVSVLVLSISNAEIFIIFLLILIFYRFLLWVFISRRPLDKYGKPYRLALFVIGCYWGLYVPRSMMHSYIVEPYEYRLTEGTINFILSILLSIFFFGAVHVYQRYVKGEPPH